MDDLTKNLQSKIGTAQEEDWLETMPEAIGNWLGSSELTYLIINLNRRLGLGGVKIRIIPELILKLYFKKIAPENLAENVAKQLGVSKDIAQTIAKEMEEKMLRPIELPLRRGLGIDIKKIYLPGPITTPPAPQQSPAPIFQAPPTPSQQPIANSQTPEKPPSSKPTETKIPITVIKEEPGNDSWLNKLK